MMSDEESPEEMLKWATPEVVCIFVGLFLALGLEIPVLGWWLAGCGAGIGFGVLIKEET